MTDQQKSDINNAAQLIGHAADVLLDPVQVSAHEALFNHILMLYIARATRCRIENARRNELMVPTVVSGTSDLWFNP